jgi:hypothetical protein
MLLCRLFSTLMQQPSQMAGGSASALAPSRPAHASSPTIFDRDVSAPPAWRSRRPASETDRLPCPAADRFHFVPSDTSIATYSRCHSSPCEIGRTRTENPTTGAAGCCACAASGHAAPLRSVMNSRRLMWSSRRVSGPLHLTLNIAHLSMAVWGPGTGPVEENCGRRNGWFAPEADIQQRKMLVSLHATGNPQNEQTLSAMPRNGDAS